MKIVGSREFRECFARYVNGNESVVLTRHGRIGGVFFPVNPDDTCHESFQKMLVKTVLDSLVSLLNEVKISATDLESISHECRYLLFPDLMNEELRKFIDEQRDCCLWFMDKESYPENSEEILFFLKTISRNGDLEAYRRAEEFKQWHLQNSR